jgi:long-chain fatty acid transport protein
MPIRLGRLIGIMAVSALGASAASAQTNQEVNSTYQFNFSNPGARSLAMGGSLTGLADDATAALTNPSGLPLLPAVEVSFEGRSFNFSNLFTNAGNVGRVSGLGVDVLAGLDIVESDDSTFSPSFLSFTFPRANWAVAGYRHELSRFETTVATQGAFQDVGPVPGGFTVSRLNPIEAAVDLEIVNYGVSAGFRPAEQVLLGAGITFATFKLDSLQRRFCFACLPFRGFSGQTPLIDRPGEPAGAPLATAENVQFLETQSGDDTAAGFNVGVTVLPTPRVAFGASYRRGPEFTVDITASPGPAVPQLPIDTGAVAPGVFEGTFKVPDVAAFGVVVKPALTFRSSDVLRLSGEVRLVSYSDLADGIVVSTDPNDVTAGDFEVDNGTELRIGGEYLAVGDATVALRGGVWFDPDHDLRYVGNPTDRAALIFRPGEDEWHYTAGAGVTYQRVQVDGGFDWSPRVTTFAFSLIVRF